MLRPYDALRRVRRLRGRRRALQKQGNSCTTYCMLHDWPATGDFELLIGSKYLTTDANLLRGDVLVSEGHTVMALEDGKNAEEETEW